MLFDLDDTILMSNIYKHYTDIIPDSYLNYLMDNINCKKFIYTNGTLGHAQNSLKSLDNGYQFKGIFARDTLPYMKPDFRSFNHVQNLLYYNHKCNRSDKFIFFDDLPNNLKTAKSLGWMTVWINPKCDDFYFDFIDYKFKTLIESLIYFKDIL